MTHLIPVWHSLIQSRENYYVVTHLYTNVLIATQLLRRGCSCTCIIYTVTVALLWMRSIKGCAVLMRRFAQEQTSWRTRIALRLGERWYKCFKTFSEAVVAVILSVLGVSKQTIPGNFQLIYGWSTQIYKPINCLNIGVIHCVALTSWMNH